jgi:hypothetical protein
MKYELMLSNLAVWAKNEDMFNGKVTEVATIFYKYKKYKELELIYNYYRDKFYIEKRINELKDKIDYLFDDLVNLEGHEYNEMYNECDALIEYGDAMLDKLTNEEKIIFGVYE